MRKPITVVLLALWIAGTVAAGGPATIEGQVRLPSGRGARAEIHLFPFEDVGRACPALRAGGWGNLLIGADPGLSAAAAVETRSVRTAADGTFRFDQVQGVQGLFVDIEGFAPRWLTADPGQVVEIEPADGTSVHVYLGGADPPPVGISGELIPLDVCGAAMAALGSRAIAGPWVEEKALHWEQVPAGVYAMRLAAEGHERLVSAAIVVGERPLAFRWIPEKGNTVEGSVVRPDGGALDGAVVTARWGHREETVWTSAEVDSRGRWRLTGLPAQGTVRLTAVVPGVVRTAGETGVGMWRVPEGDGPLLTLDAPDSEPEPGPGNDDWNVVTYRARDGGDLPVQSLEMRTGGGESLFVFGDEGEVAIRQPSDQPRRVTYPGESSETLVKPDPPPGPGEPARVTLPRRIALHGSVVDGFDKTPLAGAEIWAEAATAALIPLAVSGRDGAWILPWTPPREADLRARLPGYADTRAHVGADDRGPHLLEMVRPSSIQVHVRGLDENQTVPFDLREPRAAEAGIFRRGPRQAPIPNGDRTLEDLEPGRYTLLAGDDASGRITRTLVLAPGERRSIAFDFSSGFQLSGRVRVGERPLVDEPLLFLSEARETFTVRKTSTDARGNYEIALPAAGTYEVQAKETVGSRTVVEVEDRSRQTLDLLFGGGSILGRVMDDNAQPLSDARITLGCRTISGPGHMPQAGGWPLCAFTKTDSHGTFELTALEEGEYRIATRAAGHVSRESETFELSDAERRVLPDILLAEEDTLFLRVRGAGGLPLAGARVVSSPPDHLFDSSRVGIGQTDERGLVELRGLRSGSHAVVIRPVKGPLTVLESLRLESRDKDDPLEIRLGQGGDVHAVVVDSTGNPVPDARLSVFDARGNDLSWLLADWFGATENTLTDGAGRANLGRLAVGHYSVGIVGEDDRRPVEVVAGGVHEVELVAP